MSELHNMDKITISIQEYKDLLNIKYEVNSKIEYWQGLCKKKDEKINELNNTIRELKAVKETSNEEKEAKELFNALLFNALLNDIFGDM